MCLTQGELTFYLIFFFIVLPAVCIGGLILLYTIIYRWLKKRNMRKHSDHEFAS